MDYSLGSSFCADLCDVTLVAGLDQCRYTILLLSCAKKSIYKPQIDHLDFPFSAA